MENQVAEPLLVRPYRLLERAKSLFQQFYGSQLIDSATHPEAFRQVRAEYIDTRVRLLALIFALLTPLWIPVDLMILPAESFFPVLALRLMLAGVLYVLWRQRGDVCDLATAQRRLLLLMVTPAIFHLGTQYVLGDSIQGDSLISYTFLPFLIIAMHCVFPLTLKEGLLLACFTIFTLSLDELAQQRMLTTSSLNHLWLLSLIMSIAIWAQLSQLHMQIKLHLLGTSDGLTGLLTRKALMSQLDVEYARAQRYERPLSIMLMDLDHFKSINDTHGHRAGDAVLVAFARALRKRVRQPDMVGRYGGEEFIVALPETDLAGAQRLAERIREDCAALLIEHDDITLKVSCSIGCTALAQHQSSSLDQLIEQADTALYQAKAGGRNRVVVAS